MIEFFNQLIQGFTWAEALPVIASLVVIEGLLSVDNALAIAAMTKHLEPKKRGLAMNIGYFGAYAFRVVALIFAAFLIKHKMAMLLGSGYLIWLMASHFSSLHDQNKSDLEGEFEIKSSSFMSTVMMIALMDLSLSVDNVLAATAFSSKDMLYVYIGVLIGIITLRFVAGFAVKWIEKFPVLEHVAFILIGYVGGLLLFELLDWVHLEKMYKFVGIVLVTLLSLIWSENEKIQKLTLPILKLCNLPLRLFDGVVKGVWWVVSFPYRFAISKR